MVTVGGTVTLRVRTDPGFPINFVSMGFGRFDSGFGAISVAADADGIASARFTATPGTTAQVPIQASSPVRAGVLNLLVQVE
jgi:hypothetical protein